jgi:hypothetical protein
MAQPKGLILGFEPKISCLTYSTPYHCTIVICVFAYDRIYL